MDLEARARQLYEATIKTLDEAGMMGLLSAAGDAQEKVVWSQASPKTRTLFHNLAVNLTEAERRG